MDKKILTIFFIIIILLGIIVGSVYYLTREKTDNTQDDDLTEGDTGIDDVFGEDPNTEPPQIPS